jgi:glycosyltransferase involved in cell wall biosynthesis
LEQTDICILTSKSGLPCLARIWKGYKTGASNRCWRNTCSSSKWKNGFVVAQKEELFYAALVKLIANESLRQFWRRIYETILNNYSEEVIKQYLNWVQKI